MVRPRQQLHDLLAEIVGSYDRVYFQPPNGLQMKYPCIVYERGFADVQHSDNLPYRRDKRYTVTVIDADPDSSIPEKVAELPMCAFNRFFTADNLNHDVYNLYF